MSKHMLGVALRETRGPLKDLTDKLCGADGKAWLEALKRFLRKENPWARTWAVWKKIKLGTGLRTTEDFNKALFKVRNCLIGPRAGSLMDAPSFTTNEEEEEVGLVVVSLSDLGFEKETKYSDICKRAQKLGLDLCPAEVGPQLRLQFTDQLRGFLLIGMKPIILKSLDEPCVFLLGRNSAGWLAFDAADVGPDVLCSPGDRWVFLLRN